MFGWTSLAGAFSPSSQFLQCFFAVSSALHRSFFSASSQFLQCFFAVSSALLRSFFSASSQFRRCFVAVSSVFRGSTAVDDRKGRESKTLNFWHQRLFLCLLWHQRLFCAPNLASAPFLCSFGISASFVIAASALGFLLLCPFKKIFSQAVHLKLSYNP